MSYSVVKLSLNAVAIAASFSLIPASFVQAATVTYTFTGSIDSGSLINETYSGSFSFEDALLTGSGDEYLTVSNLNLSFLGVTFTLDDADSTPEVSFLDGQFLGLSYSVSSFEPSFAFTPGFFGLDDAWFSYDAITGNAGSGSINYNAVPEPLTILGSLGAIGFGAFFKRKLS